jgi:anti-sigma factor RsiW
MAHLSIDLIERYALRELSDVEVQRVNKHVGSCSECEDRLQQEIDLAAAMHSSRAAKVRELVNAEKSKPAQ